LGGREVQEEGYLREAIGFSDRKKKKNSLGGAGEKRSLKPSGRKNVAGSFREKHGE